MIRVTQTHFQVQKVRFFHALGHSLLDDAPERRRLKELRLIRDPQAGCPEGVLRTREDADLDLSPKSPPVRGVRSRADDVDNEAAFAGIGVNLENGEEHLDGKQVRKK